MTFEAVLRNQKNTCGFCSVLKQIFHLRAHSAHCGVLLLQVSLFFPENVDIGLHPLKAAQIYVEKKSVLKKKQPTNTEVFSRKRNHCFFKGWKCWRGCGCIPEEHEMWCQWSLVVQTARGKLRRPVPPASPCPGALPSLCPGRHHRERQTGKKGTCPSPRSFTRAGAPLSIGQDKRPDQDTALRTTTLSEGGTYAASLLSHITDTREEKVRNWKRPPQPSGARQSSPGTRTLAPAPPLTNPWVKQGGLLPQPFFRAGAFGHVQRQTETLQAGYTQVKAKGSG